MLFIISSPDCIHITLLLSRIFHASLTVYGVRLFWDFRVRKRAKFGNFRSNLFEVRVHKGNLLVGTQCPNSVVYSYTCVIQFIYIH